jgi:capsular exopolysaccharide synthesis family protein
MTSKKFSRFLANIKNTPTEKLDDSLFKLDFSDLKRRGFINPAIRRSLISEEIRLIKRRLFPKMSVFDDDETDITNIDLLAGETKIKNLDHVIQFTSSVPNEGKSFIALNLALSLAIDEKCNVLLIDADTARSSLTYILKLHEYAGLTDILQDDNMPLNSVLKREVNLPITVLPAGSGVASATDLLGGRRMKRLIHEISHKYNDRIVIFDSPPLLAGTEAVVLSHNVGHILYVVDASATPKATIEAGLTLLDDYDRVSFVLNKTPKFANSDQFGSYYEYYGTTPK